MDNNENNLTLADQQFPLPYDAYAAFDALTLKQLMLTRLNENSVFTDQIYEGSNFNNFIDVIAYSYNVLLYYLNKTGNESLFSTAQIYENINKIVKVLNYNPVGIQSSILKFEATANTNLPPGIYTVPRYSYFTINDIVFSFTQDQTFIKATSGIEFLKDFSEQSYLVQGTYREYPLYPANGSSFEQVTINALIEDRNVSIDHNSIDVYVRNEYGQWEQWQRVDNIFLGNGNDKIFECRFNENQKYTIKFGNNVTGKQLKTGYVVAIYYIETDKNLGEIGAGTLNNNNLFIYRTEQYDAILPQVRDASVNLINFGQASNISFTNRLASSTYSEAENTDQIRTSAPNLFKAQNRLVTTNDFAAYVKTNFNNIVQDVKVVNNWEYLDGHVKYLYNIGLKSPSEDSRVLYNQVKFADSCNFNDVYIYCLPKTFTTNSLNSFGRYLNPTAKQAILAKVDQIKLATIEPIIMDPVYVGIGFGLGKGTISREDYIDDILSETKLIIQKSSNVYTSDVSIRDKVAQVFMDFFDPKKIGLNFSLSLEILSQRILAIQGVSSIFTFRRGLDYENITPGISLAVFNPVYSGIDEDLIITTQDMVMPFFKVPFLFDLNQMKSNIIISDTNYIDSGTREF